ncbi:MAG TPA: asparagine synthase (glutamine-hydrolyzing), partial [Polyangia bacterium]|nr:asparagine synthase (glutamine-hydrolyzing) [Polyangia bacterium]
MCGIVAVCGAPVAAERVAAAVAALAHRGPDGRGVWRAPDGRVALGHARLAVVAPSDGAQPVTSEDGAVVAVVNGEIYDAAAVGRSLAARGHRLRGRGDAELLVHLYEEHGDRLVEQLRGELAFVLWDARRRRLVAARDRFGVKPLLWAAHGGGVVLASETRALWALGVARRWDDESFFHAAHTQYPWPDRTLFDGVRQVEPGGMLIWDSPGGVQTRRWVVEHPGGDVRAALDEAVRLRTVADAPVAVQLSGGVDSTAVAALAVRHRPDVRAFTVSFAAGGDYDEVAIARASAAAIGIPLEVVTLDGPAIADIWPRAVAHAEQLAVNGHLAGKWALSRAMRDAGCKVALTGEGADELFAGYPHLRRDAGAAASHEASHEASRGLMLPDGEGLPTDGVRARLGFVPTWIEAKATLGRRVRSLLAPDLVARFGADDPYGALVERAHVTDGPAVRRSAQAWMASALAQYILRTLGDAMEMAHGIEGRVPFLDPMVADAALAIAPDALVAGEIDKPVLRAAVRDIVPPAVLARPKHPFLAPPLSVLAPVLVQDLLRAHAR